MKHNVKLYGWLAEKYGSITREIDADKLMVLISGLCDSNSEMKRDIMNNQMMFVLNNNDNDWFALEPELIGIDLSNYKNLHIIPSVEGGAPAIAGVIIAAVGATGAAAIAIEIATMILVTVALAGISMLMTSSPQLSNPAQQAQDASTKQSFLFNGAVNVTEQGGIVQIVYGKMRVGSTVISAGITTEDY